MPGSSSSPTPKATAASSSETSGPATAIPASRPGVSAGRSISETPPSRCRLIRRTGRPERSATTVWLSSCTRTDTYSSSAKVSDTAYRQVPSPGTSRSTVAANPQVIRPATRNQAGVTSTGTPNGRAITNRPAPGRRGPAGSSSTR